MIGEVKKLLVIPHIQVHNANALSSPFTIGFPAMTAWLGAVHALQRQLNNQQIGVLFNAVGVISHDIDLQTYKGENDYVHSIVGTGNPLDKTGARSAFIEEARCHLDVSLVIEFDNVSVDERTLLIEQVTHLLHSKMKIASGDIKRFNTPICMNVTQGDDSELKKLQRHLMPGYALIERRDLMIDAMNEGQDALQALIDFTSIHYSCESNDTDNTDKVQWFRHSKQVNGSSTGWIVPIATGFYGISDLAPAKNQRDPDTLHRFAESLVTLGEFKMPHRVDSVEALLWRYYTQDDYYLCQQSQFATPEPCDSGNEFE
ncbi:type I-F CRISPR-associated protein Csy2 [Pseudoalteromonas sp. JBTF-M23]|uniref:Type I-F CRISPR-associated protein Csy2 n=1 Tax=Pseudoalteromonas caenipelagi TaxID=2726988 RepID=A0A849VCD2_9GAMM|nr:type I-F CRISPR-associated protein Csy2 [Pseudoalteromonas caenipelagi]NOU50450.1 type I-F CRISPR-associated protein Csy2 [Pseudoalteromonas caenipelagi]